MSKCIYLIAHDIRSTHNVGSLFRTADGFGVTKIFLTGYTPYPKQDSDQRLPHESSKINKQIAKTALGAEKSVAWERCESINEVIAKLKSDNVLLLALEQAASSKPLNEFRSDESVALIIGNELTGIDNEILDVCDEILEIPMKGAKESFNVAAAAAIALYQLACRA